MEDGIACISSQRYFNHRLPVAKAPPRFGWLFGDLDDQRFKQEVHMARPSFYRILDMLQVHESFHPSHGSSQTPVSIQLAVAFYRFGTYGNGSSIGHVCRVNSFSGTCPLVHFYFGTVSLADSRNRRYCCIVHQPSDRGYFIVIPGCCPLAHDSGASCHKEL